MRENGLNNQHKSAEECKYPFPVISGIDRGLRVVKQSAENSVQQMNGSLTPREIMSIGAVMSNSERGSRRIEIPAVDSKLERLDQILDEY